MTWRMSSVCMPKGIRYLAYPPQWPGLPRLHRLPGSPRHPLQGLSSRRADGLSHAVVRTAIGHAQGHALWRLLGRGYWLPALRALLYIRVVTLGILAIVPERGSSRRLARRLGGG